MNTDELSHVIRQIAGQQQLEFRPVVYGHVSQYDPATHRVKAILPALRDADTAPTETPWMPLCTNGVGNGFGLQIAPYGGATLADPTKGEQIIVGLFSHSSGQVICAAFGMTWNLAQVAPGGLEPGESILRHSSGSFTKMHANNDIEQNSQQDILGNATRDVVQVAQRDMQFSASGTLHAGAGSMDFVTTDGGIGITSAEDLTLNAAGNVIMDGGKVFFDPPLPTSGATSGQLYLDLADRTLRLMS